MNFKNIITSIICMHNTIKGMPNTVQGYHEIFHEDCYSESKNINEEQSNNIYENLRKNIKIKLNNKSTYKFIIKGREIVATSRKDAIKRYNHLYIKNKKQNDKKK